MSMESKFKAPKGRFLPARHDSGGTKEAGFVSPKGTNAKSQIGISFQFHVLIVASGTLDWIHGPHTFCDVLSLRFSTKKRVNSIPRELRPKLWEYIGGIAKQNGLRSVRVGGTANHIHVALHIPASMNIAKSMQLIKAGSSKWLNEHPIPARFEWQEGYGAFSIGIAQIAATVSYIDAQEEHHRTRTFEEEYLSFLKRHAIGYDERYVLG